MSSSLDHCADVLRRLTTAVRQLERDSAQLEVAGLAGREWYESLIRKLLPQIGDNSFLVVAVVGGTNIGKSVVFNHLAGFRASATSPLASGTKHATVLVPPGFGTQHDLAGIFPGFELIPWQQAEQTLQEDERHFLFWRERDPHATGPQFPDNLLILDTPDVDSVALINWERADHVRQCADVLIAVLTQQKYNDAAVKEFFRKAAHEDKLVIVVFNQCLLPEDEEYWPIWVQTFCEQTGIQPQAVFLAPSDRRAAEANQLPFYERPWPQSGETVPAAENASAANLMQEISQLRFGEIKIQTLQGSLRQLLDLQQGIPGWQQEITRKAQQYAEAAEILSTNRLAQINRWPNVSNRVMIEQIRQWWAQQREGWAANVHQFYNGVGKLITKPLEWIPGAGQTTREPPLETYRQQEWNTILESLEGVFERLTWMRDLGNPLLTPRLDQLLSGNARSEFIQRLREKHAQLDLQTELSELIARQLSTFRESSPDYYLFFRRLDTFAAAARPAVSVGLFMLGMGPVGNALLPAVTDTALQGVLHAAGEAVGATVLTTVGDKVLSEGASTSAGYLEAQFRQLHATFAQTRAAWLAAELQRLLGPLPEDLLGAAKVPRSETYQAVSRILSELRQVMGT